MEVIKDIRRIVGDTKDSYSPTDPKELNHRILTTLYMGTVNSSSETFHRAKQLAAHIGAYHLDLKMDGIVSSIVNLFTTVTSSPQPQFSVNGGTRCENQALQNIQARLRMVLSYMFAQLTLWSKNRPSASLLVLGTSNVDEALRGYLTKYDCSSADINPIGSISKTDLKRFITYCAEKFQISSLSEFLEAPPTAELEPRTEKHIQTD
eukprot:Sdes_comp9752_c0_seq2m1266